MRAAKLPSAASSTCHIAQNAFLLFLVAARAQLQLLVRSCTARHLSEAAVGDEAICDTQPVNVYMSTHLLYRVRAECCVPSSIVYIEHPR